ncbi:Ribosomal protein S18 acetylase RimI [Amphritea atlantica]|uniref:Ribosomal protein S18 acetylase RimI n=1 Tax=Amphritea atlantica TaxID=355243 RepID=A0A1H9HF01_9GAMM|nr:GNAT family N-acetyltransferase [Amphritea atlantica]SEQ60910.1 Ribosomal protein S18 acetylase RimI [Amphritea atlantica]
MSIRIAVESDVHQIADLVASLSHFYLDEPGKELPVWFRESITEAAFAVRVSSPEYLNLVYEEGGVLMGYISVKGGSHLYHLFVAQAFQGRGISRLLWLKAKESSQSKRFSLRSSIYAVPVYKRFGFVESGPVGTKDGISFQPMEWDDAK